MENLATQTNIVSPASVVYCLVAEKETLEVNAVLPELFQLLGL
jgi:hypothetical protein